MAVTAVAFLGSASRAADLSAELRELDGMSAVQSKGIGYAGSLSDFYKLHVRLLAKGTAADFERLAADRVPVARAMGLYCLARARSERAIPILRAAVNDDTPVPATQGCVGGQMTIGLLARHLLRNRNYLEVTDARDPLVSAAEVFVEDVRLFAADDEKSRLDVRELDSYRSVYLFLANAGGAMPTPPEILAAARHLPWSMPGWKLAKAVGRASADDVGMAFLTHCLTHPAVDGKTKLAAASGLTRDAHPAALAAIVASAAALDAAEPGQAKRLADEARLRRKLHDLKYGPSANVFSPSTRLFPGGDDNDVEKPVDEKPVDKAAVAFRDAIDHPMLLEYLERGNGFVGRDDPPKVPAAQYLRMAERLATFGRSWDTYSDAVERFEAGVTPDGGGDDIESAVRRAINRAIRGRE